MRSVPHSSILSKVPRNGIFLAQTSSPARSWTMRPKRTKRHILPNEKIQRDISSWLDIHFLFLQLQGQQPCSHPSRLLRLHCSALPTAVWKCCTRDLVVLALLPKLGFPTTLRSCDTSPGVSGSEMARPGSILTGLIFMVLSITSMLIPVFSVEICLPQYLKLSTSLDPMSSLPRRSSTNCFPSGRGSERG